VADLERGNDVQDGHNGQAVAQAFHPASKPPVEGARTVADRRPQSVLDALADAETLRLNVPWIGGPRRKTPRYNVVRHGVWDADRWGWLARTSLSDHAAVNAARAAFRAVPGLRA
jgi:hypothetical protein